MIIAYLIVLGLAFGSFVGALTWRLHEKKDFIRARSQCENCGHQLGAADLIPIFSWLWLRGRCRYCRKPIGWQSPLLELAVGLLFGGSYLLWPHTLNSWQAILSFGIWLIYIILLVALLIYDFRWMLLPDSLVFPLIALGLLDAALRLYQTGDLTIINYAAYTFFGACVLGGLYWLLNAVSKGRWVGFGDVKLGLFIGITLGWQQALLVLFLANLIGSLVAIPALLLGKLSMKSRLPFGPFLILAFLIVGLLGKYLLAWYLSIILPR
jgi:prepilin signal peptidase PulO-like enzyme (type II secretory pathway)